LLYLTSAAYFTTCPAAGQLAFQPIQSANPASSLIYLIDINFSAIFL